MPTAGTASCGSSSSRRRGATARSTCELLAKAAGRLHRRAPACAALADELAAGVGAVVLTDAALADPAIERARRGARPPAGVVGRADAGADARPRRRRRRAAARSSTLSNVTLLDRPIVDAVDGQRRQGGAARAPAPAYQIRDQLCEQQRAEEALRQADQRKDEFLATLAHELRNPLAPIRTRPRGRCVAQPPATRSAPRAWSA